jgi:hypothetical protein
MTNEEYIKLFHQAGVNLVAFNPVFHCDDELRKMVEMAIEKEREECAKMCDYVYDNIVTDENIKDMAFKIRAREKE